MAVDIEVRAVAYRKVTSPVRDWTVLVQHPPLNCLGLPLTKVKRMSVSICDWKSDVRQRKDLLPVTPSKDTRAPCRDSHVKTN